MLHCHNERCHQRHYEAPPVPAMEGTFGPVPPLAPHLPHGGGGVTHSPRHSVVMKRKLSSCAEDDIPAAVLLEEFEQSLASRSSQVMGSSTTGDEMRRRGTMMTASHGGSSVNKATRHGWTLACLEEAGALRRKSKLLEAYRRTERAAVSLPTDPNKSMRINPLALLDPGYAERKLALPKALVTLVALFARHTVTQVAVSYRDFVARHRRNGEGTSQSSTSTFSVTHSVGLTAHQFELFVSEENSDDSVSTAAAASSLFRVLCDPKSHRLTATDMLVSMALSKVPKRAQQNAEYFVSLFDASGGGTIPKTVFHYNFLRKYLSTAVSPGYLPAWRALTGLLEELLCTGDGMFVYVMKEITAPPTAILARTLVNVETASHKDPCGVFAYSEWQNNADLAISVREALCVIYSVPQLAHFFDANSLDKCVEGADRKSVV